MKQTIAIFFLVLGLQRLIAQQIPDNNQDFFKAIKIETGLFKLASVDEIYTDQVYSGSGLLASIGYVNRKKNIASANLSFSLFKRHPKGIKDLEYPADPDNRLHTINHFHFEASTMNCFHLYTINNKLPLFFALNWFSSADLVMNYDWTPELLLSTLAPGLYGEYRCSKHLVAVSCTSSILSYTCRSNYSNAEAQDFERSGTWDYIKSNSRVQGLNSFHSVFLKLSYTYKYSDKLCLEAGYDFRYIYNALPRDLKSVTGIYNIGLAYKF